MKIHASATDPKATAGDGGPSGSELGFYYWRLVVAFWIVTMGFRTIT
jgi:hypothetical protein